MKASALVLLTISCIISNTNALFGYNSASFPKSMLESTKNIILMESEDRMQAIMRVAALKEIEYWVHGNWQYKLPESQKDQIEAEAKQVVLAKIDKYVADFMKKLRVDAANEITNVQNNANGILKSRRMTEEEQF